MSIYVSGNASPQNVATGANVTFSGHTNIMDVSGWRWDFGDGSPIESTQVAVHAFNSTGTFNSTVYVSGTAPESGIYLNTYIKDDFGDSTGISGFDPGWTPAFQSMFISYCSGYYAYHNMTVDTIIAPYDSTPTITGRFDFQFDFVVGCNPSGNQSVHFYLVRSGGSYISTFDFSDGVMFNNVSGSVPKPAPYSPPGQRYRVRMTRGYKLNSSGEPIEQESIQVIRGYYYDDWNSPTYQWIEATNSPVSGGPYDDNFYILLDRAQYNGYDNFILQADTGLYYSGGTSAFYSLSDSVTVSAVGEIIEISGSASGKGLIQGDQQIIYGATPVPPSGTTLTAYTPILMNKRRYVYKRGGDFLQAKLLVYKGKQLSYIENANVEFWLNYEGTWKKYEDYTTNRYGMSHLKHNTDGVPEIDCCLGLARVLINGTTYNSNLVRFNFVEGVLDDFIIDAGPSGVSDRSLYDIFDGSFRSNYFDRMRI